MWDMIRESLVFLSPLILISLYLTALVIDLFLCFFRSLVSYNHLNSILLLIEKGQIDHAKEAIRSPIYRGFLSKAKLIFTRKDSINHEDYLFGMALKEIQRLKNKVSILPSLANISTLMGLLGTVAGMITLFYRMNQTSSTNPYILAGGISRALITTAAGLIIAVPAYLFHLYFKDRIISLEEQFELLIDSVMNLFRERKWHQKD